MINPKDMIQEIHNTTGKPPDILHLGDLVGN